MTEKLDELRIRLDQIDRRIVDSLAERQAVVGEVAKVKVDGATVLRDPKREEQLLRALSEYGKNAGVDRHFVRRLYREILDHSLRSQQVHLSGGDRASERTTVVVAYQGGEGSYSHLAATRHFEVHPANVVYEGKKSFDSMLQSVTEGESDFAILPIENTTAGSINESYDLLARMNLVIVGEEIQRVDHCLLAIDEVPLSHIRRVYSHPVALAQCGGFLSALRECHVEAFNDTALSAAKIKEDRDLSQAAIASAEAARLYDLKILRTHIADQKENYTRMVVVSRDPIELDPRIPAKTSLLFATRHEHGALASCLNILHEHGLNMTKLESRPRPNTPWEYIFYVDFEGRLDGVGTGSALQSLSSATGFLKVLGTYPSRIPKESEPAAIFAQSESPESSSAPRSGPAATRAAPARDGGSIRVKAGSPRAEEGEARIPVTKQPYRLASRVTRLKDTLIRFGDVELGGDVPVVIAGPCAVESREQIQNCAREVKEQGGAMLRGGCFKPRTSPYSFQGLGFEALDLLEEAGREFGLPIVTEVLHPADVARVAHQADFLQIGARNMQNFALLKEVGRIDRPVMLKRGLTATVDEWLQAAEYILAQGNQRVVLCERGIRTFEQATRNTLDLSAVVVARERTHLPIVVDPSHAVGVRRWIPTMAEASLAVGAHGVMLEIHPDPNSALSDGPQALTFQDFESLMKRLPYCVPPAASLG
ncbi:MAG: bifunctional 3-deoxy-7-phosphoheptulonate synthase/chorismate mutase [Myxococcota bacterium]